MFVPGVSAAPVTRTFDEGPIKLLKITQAEVGVAITLVTRERPAQAMEQLDIGTGDRPIIRIGATSRPQPFGDATAEPEQVPSTKSATLAGPLLLGRNETPRAAPIGLGASPASGVPAMALVGAVLVALAAVAWWLRRGRAKESSGTTIQVLAVRPIGPKQKLLMVDTGGERFLLATSDKEVQLLSSLGADDTSDRSFGNTLDRTSQDRAAPADLDGLFKLRGQRAATREVAA